LSPIPSADDPAMPPLASFRAFSRLPVADGAPAGWRTWSPRAEIAPRFSVDAAVGRSGGGSLRISGGGNPGAFGAWRARITGVVGGRTYRLSAWCRTEGVARPHHDATARLEWLDAAGVQLRLLDNALEDARDGEWTRLSHTIDAPIGAVAVHIDLGLRWSEHGTVWWDDVELAEAQPVSRPARLATVHHRPKGTASPAASIESFCALIERDAPAGIDVLCLPEGATVVGTGRSYAEVAESVPGPTTARLGALAKRLHCHIVAGVYERVGAIVYNTSVLIGRDGAVVGTYRKTHLPQNEADAGLMPGDGYPVFATDVGRLGMMICWDNHFPEPARALALNGAEILLLPIWGGSDVLARARAMENHVFLVASSYDMRCIIVDPTGAILAEATAEHPVAVADVDLARAYHQPWMGNLATSVWKERRPDLPPFAVAHSR
jgi:predicted amidohydrolase